MPRVFTDEWRKKISDAAKARATTPEGKALLQAMSDARPAEVSEETRAKISEASLGRVQSEETKQKRVESRAGYQHSDETKAKIAEKAIGRKQSEESRRKKSEAMKGRKQSPEHIAARAAARSKNGWWAKTPDIGELIKEGKNKAFAELPEKKKDIIRQRAADLAKTHQTLPDKVCVVDGTPMDDYNSRRPERMTCSEECKAIWLSGSNAPNWKGGKTSESTKERQSTEAQLWRYLVVARDGFTCQECGASDNIHAHHIKPWAQYPELRYNIDNGKTLCIRCHEATHGRSLDGTTSEQYLVEIICAWDDKVKAIPAWRVRPLNYCNKQCAGKHRSVIYLLRLYGKDPNQLNQ